MLTIQEQVPASDMTSEAEAWPTKDWVKRCISSDFILALKSRRRGGPSAKPGAGTPGADAPNQSRQASSTSPKKH
ncbi:MAG: hypothetical protein KF734_17165 [Saprospiraceae bacterium]|nr:hypothetical protein [Saprospiraceae bacterium]